MSRYFCPRCGRPVTKSDLSDSENGYPFQCKHCDEDFYAIECPEMCVVFSKNASGNMDNQC